jgi:chemotaxis protein MotB
MATFADMATLLMAFFVLLLSFAEMNVPKFKQINGSMKNSFGIQRLIPVVEAPKAESLIAQNFSPARAEPTPINTIRQETTDDRKENVVLKTDVAPPNDQQQQDLEKVKSALSNEIAKGQVEAKLQDGKVVVQVNDVANSPAGGSTQGSQQGGSAQGAQTGGASAQGTQAGGASAQGTQAGGASAQGTQAAGASTQGTLSAGQAKEGEQQAGQVPQGVIDMYAKVAQVQAEVATPVTVQQAQNGAGSSGGSGSANVAQTDKEYNRIRSELAKEIQAGKAEVERDGARIIIRLAEQGSFQSGSADLQAGFIDVLKKVGGSVASSQGRVFIEGHTDNVPVVYNQRFQSNWDLSGARAGAVADYLIGQSGLTQSRVSVSGYADTRPIDSNDTATGRARNRRIEVIIDGAK